MKDFSVYEQALEAAGQTAENLGAVSHISRRDYDERATFFFRAQVPTLEYISLLIENGLLLRTHRGGRVYAGFEKLSRMEGVVDRYMRIADVSERVYIFGECDWKPPRHPNMRIVELKGDIKLAREWFVIADSPTMHVALVAVDEDGFDVPVLEARNFRSFKSSDTKLVDRLALAVESLIDRSLA
jgi:DICT domain-containing protein